MLARIVLDVLLGVVLVVLLVLGWRGGVARSLGGVLGLAAGGIGAYFLMPVLAGMVGWPTWRVLLIVIVAVLLLIAGHAAGTAIGSGIGSGGDRATRPGGMSRLLGAVFSLAAGALAISLVAGGVASLGAPVISQAARQSAVVGAIDRITPDLLDAALTQLRGAVLAQGMPEVDDPLSGLAEALRGPRAAPEGGEALMAALQEAAASVVRVAGTAYACGQNLTGSGVVVAPDRVVTNAHVVAGVDQPVVEAPNGQALEGRVVYFDPDDDLAVIATRGLEARAVPLGDALHVGEVAAVAGYPWGGPYSASPARVLAVSSELLRDIYGTEPVEREIYTLAVDVDPGNSGGPLIDSDGGIAGIVFATAADGDRVGYALTGTELAPVVEAAPALSGSVGAGTCVTR